MRFVLIVLLVVALTSDMDATNTENTAQNNVMVRPSRNTMSSAGSNVRHFKKPDQVNEGEEERAVSMTLLTPHRPAVPASAQVAIQGSKIRKEQVSEAIARAKQNPDLFKKDLVRAVKENPDSFKKDLARAAKKNPSKFKNLAYGIGIPVGFIATYATMIWLYYKLLKWGTTSGSDSE